MEQVQKQVSVDSTIKYVFKQGHHAVLIRGKRDKNTLCVSSQVGCLMKCQFCLTGKMNTAENLSREEIVEQFEVALQDVLEERKIARNEVYSKENPKGTRYAKEFVTAIVYMGMGEPMNNYEEVVDSIEKLHEHYAYPYDKISVSSVGNLPMMKKFFERDWKVNLALSLHSPFQERRDMFMPMVKHWKIQELVEFCNEYSRERKDKMMVSYLMIKGLTDRDEDLEELLKLGFVKETNINLIYLNDTFDFEGNTQEASAEERVLKFREALLAAGYKTFTRRTTGTDIKAACGMLS